jgi:hypothetical protein
MKLTAMKITKILEQKISENKLSCKMPRDAGQSAFTLSNAAISSLKDAGLNKEADIVLNFYTKNQPDLVSISNPQL